MVEHCFRFNIYCNIMANKQIVCKFHLFNIIRDGIIPLRNNDDI